MSESTTSAVSQPPLHGLWFRRLLVLIAATLLLLPVLLAHPIAMRTVSLAISVTLIGAVMSVNSRRALVAAAIVLAIAHQAPNLIPGLQHVSFRLAGLLADCALMLLASAVIIVTVWREEDVTTDTILGGIAVYLLLGAVWGGIYSVLEVISPGSFAVGGQVVMGASDLTFQSGHFPKLLYFSYITLTTLGYGDVTPVHPIAAGLAVTEAVTGQLFIAVFIARTVGVYIAQRLRS